MRSRDYGKSILSRTKFKDLEESVEAILSLSDVKDWAKITHDLEDSMIQGAIDDIIGVTQEEMNFSLYPREIVATYESFAAETRLPYGPVIEISKVERLDRGDKKSITDYYLKGDSIYFDKTYAYDSPYYRQGLEVTYTAGYDFIPKGILLPLKQAILTAINDREDNVLGGVTEIPSNSRRKLLKFKRY